MGKSLLNATFLLELCRFHLGSKSFISFPSGNDICLFPSGTYVFSSGNHVLSSRIMSCLFVPSSNDAPILEAGPS